MKETGIDFMKCRKSTHLAGVEVEMIIAEKGKCFNSKDQKQVYEFTYNYAKLYKWSVTSFGEKKYKKKIQILLQE